MIAEAASGKGWPVFLPRLNSATPGPFPPGRDRSRRGLFMPSETTRCATFLKLHSPPSRHNIRNRCHLRQSPRDGFVSAQHFFAWPEADNRPSRDCRASPVLHLAAMRCCGSDRRPGHVKGCPSILTITPGANVHKISIGRFRLFGNTEETLSWGTEVRSGRQCNMDQPAFLPNCQRQAFRFGIL